MADIAYYDEMGMGAIAEAITDVDEAGRGLLRAAIALQTPEWMSDAGRANYMAGTEGLSEVAALRYMLENRDTGYRKVLDWDSTVTFSTIGATTWNFRVVVRRIGNTAQHWVRYQQTAGTDIADEPTVFGIQPATGGINGAPVVSGGLGEIYGPVYIASNDVWPTSGSTVPRFVITPGDIGGWYATDGDGFIFALKGGGIMTECHGGAAHLQGASPQWVTAPFPSTIPGTLVANEWGDAL